MLKLDETIPFDVSGDSTVVDDALGRYGSLTKADPSTLFTSFNGPESSWNMDRRSPTHVNLAIGA